MEDHEEQDITYVKIVGGLNNDRSDKIKTATIIGGIGLIMSVASSVVSDVMLAKIQEQRRKKRLDEINDLPK